MIEFVFALMCVLTMFLAFVFDTTGKVRYWWGTLTAGLSAYILLFIEEFWQ